MVNRPRQMGHALDRDCRFGRVGTWHTTEGKHLRWQLCSSPSAAAHAMDVPAQRLIAMSLKSCHDRRVPTNQRDKDSGIGFLCTGIHPLDHPLTHILDPANSYGPPSSSSRAVFYCSFQFLQCVCDSCARRDRRSGLAHAHCWRACLTEAGHKAEDT